MRFFMLKVRKILNVFIKMVDNRQSGILFRLIGTFERFLAFPHYAETAP